jgi:hypothetical protein
MSHNSRALVFALALACAAVAAVAAHHDAASLGTVTLSQPVKAGGVTLQPGTYEVRLTGEHMTPLPGQSEDAVQQIEFRQNGAVVARDAAEVMPAEGHVGTSGRSATRLRVQRLKGDEFVRISANRNGERVLVHLAVAK